MMIKVPLQGSSSHPRMLSLLDVIARPESSVLRTHVVVAALGVITDFKDLARQ